MRLADFELVKTGMINLNEALKFAEKQTKRNAAMQSAQGKVVPKKKPSSGKRDSISPDMAKLLASSSPLLTKGLENLLQDGNFDGLSGMISLEGLMGMAAQFLPPWAGDALAVGKALASGGLAGAADALLSKYLPPELKAVYDAIKNLPGGWKKFLDDLFNNPKEPQGADGFWAARLSDVVVCKGGVGPIIAPCLPTVLIGGMPAARRGDIAKCNEKPIDKVVIGEPTVWMGGTQIFAARRFDDTEHQGKITTGFQTVHIGKKRNQADMCAAGKCIADAADSGAATISGAGINPVGEGLLGDIASGLGDMAKNKIADFASQKAGELVQKALGVKKDEIYGGGAVKKDKSNDKPKPQPKIDDDDG